MRAWSSTGRVSVRQRAPSGAVGGGGGGTRDLGADVSNAINSAVHTVSALPPETLVLIVVLVFVGLIILRKAF